ncbi:MAG: hypothetical protein KatS3mg102_1024 [Planctomycetota bacterium]|nr:MAG: hypothetical protein KatS3mg102_1024 [Planctomycetota bacterium]
MPPNFEAAFAAESHRLRVDRTRFLLWAAMVLYPAFWFLDLLTAPAFARQFLFIRLSVLGLYVLTMALTYTPAGQRVVRALAMGYIVASAIGISLMAALLGGFGSDYYVGNMIVLFVVGFFMPWRVADSALCCGLIVLGYLVINLLADGPSRAMISPLFFLAGTSVFVCLATLASERTRRRDLLMRLRVERANEELRELDEAKTRFFANVSHELRTPLTMILGPLEQLLQRREQQGESAERAVLAAMEANARRLLRQVNALLELAKAEAGRLRLELRGGQPGPAGGRGGGGRRPAGRPPRDRAARRGAGGHTGLALGSRQGRSHDRQPAEQRAQVHAGGRAGGGARRGDRECGLLRGGRHRARHPARRARADLRAVFTRWMGRRRASTRARAWGCR